MKISHFAQGRDNNFNLIRMVAALAVLVTHSFALSIGTGEAEPLRSKLDMTIGTFAVDVFFITSGFLVTASLLSKQSVVEFVWARALRIFPALWVMLLLLVFVIGPIFTALPLVDYFLNFRTYFYLAKCSTLLSGVAYVLPGVFDGNPYKSAVNGSLWTMPVEVRMYVSLVLVWTVLQLAKENRLRAFKMFVLAYAVLSGACVLGSFFLLHYVDNLIKLSFMFFTGAAYFVFKEYICLSSRWFLLAVVAILIATSDKQWFFITYIISIAYILFFLAYVPSGYIRKYNLLGDYSYGTYIYAFPLQQVIAAVIPGVSVLSMILISAVATILLGVTSWHILEQRALAMKRRYVNHTRELIDRGAKVASARTRNKD